MPASIATGLWLVLLVLLFYFDPAREGKQSPALWVPLLWIFMAGSRLPSQWMTGQVGMTATSLQEGSPLDRIAYMLLLALALVVLTSRSFKWGRFIIDNPALSAFIFFALISTFWSDFPLVSFKRWFRDLGDYLVLLVVLTEPHPLEAVRTVLRRTGYLLLPLSILLIKYYPEIGKQYEFWSGQEHFVGVATSKNMLGVACLVCGLFFFWDTVLRWSERRQRRTKKVLAVNVAFFVMSLWLLYLSSSATSTVCLLLGCLVILTAQTGPAQRNPRVLQVLIPSGIVTYLVLSYGFGVDINQLVTSAVGRDATFTGRTNIWHAVLSTHTNPLLGCGYDSFWLGWRLKEVWRLAGHYNEAHDGYLEIYLDLGYVGLAILGWLLISSYVVICKRMNTISVRYGSFALAMWTLLLFYNVTEAAFKGQLIWIIFLLIVIVVPLPKARGMTRVRKRALDRHEVTPSPALTA
jgi:exopolysaccharide production protein ExoQ